MMAPFTMNPLTFYYKRSSDFFLLMLKHFFLLILSFCGQIDGQLLLVCYERVRLKDRGPKKKEQKNRWQFQN